MSLYAEGMSGVGLALGLGRFAVRVEVIFEVCG